MDLDINQPTRPRVNSSGSATFMAKPSLGRTAEEFAGDKPISEGAILSAYSKYVALELISLWTPTYPDEKHNYTSRYKYRELSYSANFIKFSKFIAFSPNGVSKKPYHSFPVDKIVANNNLKCIRNLGALFFINAILYGKITDNNLYICESNSHYYFLQDDNVDFFENYYTNKRKYIDDINFDFLDTNNHQFWWDILVDDLSKFRNSFIEEVFETAIRIYSTPNQIFELIIKHILGETFDFFEFKDYLYNLKINAVKVLYKWLDTEEIISFDAFKMDINSDLVNRFTIDMERYLNFFTPNDSVLLNKLMRKDRIHKISEIYNNFNSNPLIPNFFYINTLSSNNYLQSSSRSFYHDFNIYKLYLNLQISYFASYINVPWSIPRLKSNVNNHKFSRNTHLGRDNLEQGLDVDELDFPRDELQITFNCMLKIIVENWQEISNFLDYQIWQYLNTFAGKIIDLNIKNLTTILDYETMIDYAAIVAIYYKATLKNLNNISKFLLLKYTYIISMYLDSKYLKDSYNNEEETLKYIDKTIEEFTKESGNAEVYGFLSALLSERNRDRADAVSYSEEEISRHRQIFNSKSSNLDKIIEDYTAEYKKLIQPIPRPKGLKRNNFFKREPNTSDITASISSNLHSTEFNCKK